MESLIKLLFRHRISWHGLFWLLLLVYEGLILGSVDDSYRQRFTISLIELPVKMLATYTMLYLLIDKLLLHKRYGYFLVWLLLAMAVTGTVQRMMAYYFIYPLYYPAALAAPVFFWPKVLIYTFATYAMVSIPTTIHLLKKWYVDQQSTQQLRAMSQQLAKEKLEAELKLLKSQIHPHFLFNTLNNLYALTVNQSPKAPEIVFKLSELMSYMLYDSNLAQVPLRKEIQYIENYITLEKIRYGDRLDVSLNSYAPLDGILIAPLIILPFVENSFKHGVNRQLDSVWVRVDVLTNDNALIFKIENSKAVDPAASIPEVQSGIGLRNVRKRLDIIYGTRYSLQLFNEEDTYLVVLKIELEPSDLESAGSVGQLTEKVLTS
ncbi:sensor histidine kinase [Larkinella terrae]|uniref:Sensor histidine kinase n=1 Tax=Larkinella terrae TaxID=2025311 RepID=A0A7K0EQR2_9BACT|nr:histidine kinase [Larkinella terrae]MRS64153.1 sensor histidine kinase [Larkinella terrae]